MPTALLVAEKPSIARELAAILDPQHTREQSFSRFNPVLVVRCDVGGLAHQVYITSVAGHLMERDFSPALRSWFGDDSSTYIVMTHPLTC